MFVGVFSRRFVFYGFTNSNKGSKEDVIVVDDDCGCFCCGCVTVFPSATDDTDDDNF
jgi:hypothetical protein